MSFSAQFRGREGQAIIMPYQLAMKPRRWSWSTLGGPKDATIDVEGPADMLWGLMEQLGSYVSIYNRSADQVWDGEVTMVTVQVGAVAVTLDLATVRNRVAVIYTVDNGEELETLTTDWAEDLDSLARYGRRERLESLHNSTEADALQLRDRLVAELAKPLARITRSGGRTGATLYCLGPISDLDRIYYEELRGREVYDPAAGGEHPLGWRLSSDLIGFYASAGRICDLEANLDALLSGARINVSGSTSNNGVKTISSGVAGLDPLSFVDDSLEFEASDDIYSGDNALGDLVAQEMVRFEGVSTNDEFWFIKTTGAGYVTVDPNETVDENLTGTDVTVTQGNSVVVAEPLITERPNPGSKTVVLESLGSKVAQSFTLSLPVGWPFSELRVQLRKVGEPADTVVVNFYAGADLATATLLMTTSVSGTLISTRADWVAFQTADTVDRDPALTYWFTIERSGAADAENYYVLQVDEDAGYEEGEALLWTGSAWESEPISVPFQLWGRLERAALLEDMLTAGIQNAGGVDVAVDLPDLRRMYRDGQSTARYELEQLVGGGDGNSQPLIVDALPGRVMVVRAWPESWEVDLSIDDRGRLRHISGASLDDGRSPVGRWARVASLPEHLNSLADISPAPIDQAEFDAQTGQMSFSSREQASRWSLNTLEQG